LFLLDDGRGNCKESLTGDDAEQKVGVDRVADAEFMSQLQGDLLIPPFICEDIVPTLGPGQATSELDVLVQDTKIAYLNGSITLSQMCTRVHALCKVQPECISAMCKPGRRGLGVAEVSCCLHYYFCNSFIAKMQS
jgi:hypothetical protein